MAIRVHNANQSAAQPRYVNFMLSERRREAAYESGAITGNTLRFTTPPMAGVVAHKQWDDGRDAIYTAYGNWPACGVALTSQYGDPTHGETSDLVAEADDLTLSFDLHANYGDSSCGVVTSWNPAAIPRVFVVNANGTEEEIAPGIRSVTPTLRVDGNRMKQVIWAVHHNGWHVEHALTVWHNQAVGEFDTLFSWSDEQSASWYATAPKIRFRYDYPVKLKFGANEGFKALNAQGGEIALTGSDTVIQLPMSFANGNENTGSGSVSRWSWLGRMYHGRQFTVKGWMSADTTAEPLTNINHLNGVGNATEWDGYYLFGGKVGVLPLASPDGGRTTVHRASYDITSWHFANWNRGKGGDDDNTEWSDGLIFHRVANQVGLTGGLSMVGLSQCIHGYQELYDAQCAIGDWGARSGLWMLRDGSYKLPSTTPGSRFSLRNLYPDAQSTESYFGKPDLTGAIPPNDNGSGDGFDGEHYVMGTVYSCYQLAKWDYYAYRMVNNYAHATALMASQGRPYADQPYSLRGDREPGRAFTAAIQFGAVLPEVRGLMMQVALQFGASVARRWDYRASNNHTGGPASWIYLYNLPTYAYNGTNFVTGPMWTTHSLPGLYMMYLLTQQTIYKTMFEEIGSTIFPYGTINLRPTYQVNVSVGATAQVGWQPAYYIRCKDDGWVLANDSDRTSPAGDGTGTAFNSYFNGPSGHHELGGDALRGWGMGGTVAYALLGENARGKARAADCVQTLARQSTAPSLPTPRGWWMSGYMAWGNLYDRRTTFGWGDNA